MAENKGRLVHSRIVHENDTEGIIWWLIVLVRVMMNMLMLIIVLNQVVVA
jgi:hypothetical protein